MKGPAEIVCIACPRGCRLAVDGGLNVSGNSCERGIVYGRNEVLNPVRVVSSTVWIEGGIHRRCPVKTSGSIPKHLVFAAVKALGNICLQTPVNAGQVVVSDVCGTCVDFITTRDMARWDGHEGER